MYNFSEKNKLYSCRDAHLPGYSTRVASDGPSKKATRGRLATRIRLPSAHLLLASGWRSARHRPVVLSPLQLQQHVSLNGLPRLMHVLLEVPSYFVEPMYETKIRQTGNVKVSLHEYQRRRMSHCFVSLSRTLGFRSFDLITEVLTDISKKRAILLCHEHQGPPQRSTSGAYTPTISTTGWIDDLQRLLASLTPRCWADPSTYTRRLK
ncbi:unnamed protein product [Protopolystoma xenopodis]|uniref:Uncharacterized protein n=1 Tax=Protopolystoma xenopodis TaxID=117903 RepID=A0A3S5FFQ7_9PLAT|nr:unnamed protein product [Protopolystoma xenopodis]